MNKNKKVDTPKTRPEDYQQLLRFKTEVESLSRYTQGLMKYLMGSWSWRILEGEKGGWKGKSYQEMEYRQVLLFH